MSFPIADHNYEYMTILDTAATAELTVRSAWVLFVSFAVGSRTFGKNNLLIHFYII